MRDPYTSKSQQEEEEEEAKRALSSSSPSLPRPYPVSTRAYRKKDYEYLSKFPRIGAAHPALRPSRSDVQLLQARSNGEFSDLSMTSSSTEYATSISCASSTSSAQSYVKDIIALVDMESHQHHLSDEHHPHNHISSMETSTHSTRIPMDHADSRTETDINLLHNGSDAEIKDIDNMGIAGDLPGPAEDDGSVQLSAPIRAHTKPKPRSINTPAVLPKFGSWDTKNPSSGEAYTLIFRRLRDEKKSGSLPVCGSPTHSKIEGAEEICPPEGKAKGSLHSNPQTKKGSSRRKAKDTSTWGVAYDRKRSLRWNLCCKASVLDD